MYYIQLIITPFFVRNLSCMKILPYMYDSNNKSDMQKTPYKYGVPNVITNGANEENRTPNLLITNELLYH